MADPKKPDEKATATPAEPPKPPAPPRARTEAAGDLELTSTSRIFKLLSALGEEARQRVVAYLVNRFLPKPPGQ